MITEGKLIGQPQQAMDDTLYMYTWHSTVVKHLSQDISSKAASLHKDAVKATWQGQSSMAEVKQQDRSKAEAKQKQSNMTVAMLAT